MRFAEYATILCFCILIENDENDRRACKTMARPEICTAGSRSLGLLMSVFSRPQIVSLLPSILGSHDIMAHSRSWNVRPKVNS